MRIYIYIPGTQMTLVLFEKGLVLEGSTPKIEDKQVAGTYMFIYIYILYSIYTLNPFQDLPRNNRFFFLRVFLEIIKARRPDVDERMEASNDGKKQP